MSDHVWIWWESICYFQYYVKVMIGPDFDFLWSLYHFNTRSCLMPRFSNIKLIMIIWRIYVKWEVIVVMTLILIILIVKLLKLNCVWDSFNWRIVEYLELYHIRSDDRSREMNEKYGRVFALSSKYLWIHTRNYVTIVICIVFYCLVLIWTMKGLCHTILNL